MNDAFFNSVGVAVQDLAAAAVILKQAEDFDRGSIAQF